MTPTDFSPGYPVTGNHLLYTDSGDLFLNSYVQNIYTFLLSANTLTSTSQVCTYFLAFSVHAKRKPLLAVRTYLYIYINAIGQPVISTSAAGNVSLGVFLTFGKKQR